MNKITFNCKKTKELTKIEDLLNSHEDIDEGTGYPNQNKMVQCGRLLLDYLNNTKEKGAFCVVQVLNTERSYIYGDAELNLMLWKKIIDCIVSNLPDNAYVGRVSLGIAIHLWGRNALEQIIEAIEKITYTFENMQIEGVTLANGISPFLATRTGYVIYPDDTGFLNEFKSITRFAALASSEVTSEFMVSQCNRFTPEILDKADNFVHTEKLLINSIINLDFDLYFQAQHNLITNKIIGVEALSRWKGEGLSVSGTYEYICIIENGRYAIDFTQQSFYKMIAFFNNIRSLIPPGFQLSFNVSPAVFRWPKFSLTKMVKDEIDKDPDLASHLTIEVTESAYTNKIISDIAIKSLGQLNDLGVKVSIDDFGSGYGALKLLSSNIPKYIKLDRELTTEFCHSDIKEQSYIKSLVHTVNISGLSVIAEGIETLEQKEFLIRNGIFYGQGYLYSKPLPEKEFIYYLQRTM